MPLYFGRLSSKSANKVVFRVSTVLVNEFRENEAYGDVASPKALWPEVH